jgi:hypothetical protein
VVVAWLLVVTARVGCAKMPNGIVNGLLSKKGDKMKKSGMHKMPSGKMMKNSAMVKEKGTGEMYASKAAMRKHEKKESPMMEKSEYKRGGMAKKKTVKMNKGGMMKSGKGC